MAKERGSIYDTMRGGQIVFHYIRMTLQVVKKNLKVFAIAMFIAALGFTKLATSDQIISYGFKYMMAVVKTDYLLGGDDKTQIVLPTGKEITTTWRNIYDSPQMKGYYHQLERRFYLCAGLSIGGTLILLVGWFAYLKRVGKNETKDDFIRGGALGTVESHNKRIKEAIKKTGEPSRFKIAGVGLPPKSDRSGIGLFGSPGVGKSATMLEIMAQQRELGDKNFILDPGGEFTRKFYREGYDIILSPRDRRTVYWDVWSEGVTPESYSITSNSLIAAKSSDDFFAPAARFVFEAVASKLANQARASGTRPSLQMLTNYILRVDDETLIEMVSRSDARSVLNDKSEKTAASIRATLSTFLQPLSKLPNSGPRFSFKEWIASEDDRWVFVPLTPRQRSYYRPVLSMWMEHYVMSVLSLPTNQFDGQRYNLFCDELASYNKIPSLPMFLAEARKFSGNAFLGFQNKAQLEIIYGQKGASAIEGLISTFCVFRANGTDDSEWSSKILLTSEVNKSAENLSMGSNEVRDSVGLNKNVKDHRLVTPSEIINLDDLELYIRFGKGYDVLRLSQVYPQLPDVALAMDMITDEELANRSYLEDLDDHNGPTEASPGEPEDEDHGLSMPSPSLAPKNTENDDLLPPEFEQFAAALTAPNNTPPAAPDAQPAASESKPAAKSETQPSRDSGSDSNPFVRGL